jgi:hypothetical protein
MRNPLKYRVFVKRYFQRGLALFYLAAILPFADRLKRLEMRDSIATNMTA